MSKRNSGNFAVISSNRNVAMNVCIGQDCFFIKKDANAHLSFKQGVLVDTELQNCLSVFDMFFVKKYCLLRATCEYCCLSL
jgi:hypothetical protein